MQIAKTDLKAWARANLVGVGNITFPSFTPDLSALDEEGIRWDVQQAIRHGFRSTLAACETGLSFEEAKRFVAIVADEAADRILVSVTLLFDSLAQNMEMLEHAQRSGCHTLQIGFPPNWYPHDEEQVYGAAKSMCDAARIAVILYPSPHYNLERMHPAGFPLGVLERLADLPGVVAVEAGEPGLAADLIGRVGDRVLVANPVERLLPLMWQAGRQQFIAPGTYEAMQSPDKPYVVDYFRLLRDGRAAEAMAIYWQLAPVRGLFDMKMMQTAMLGCYHWPLLKYYQWLVGGNGGYTRQPCMKIHQHEMEPIKFMLMSIGILPREPDEEFYYGRLNFEKIRQGRLRPPAGAAAVE
ncbi:MAG: dihydrodipicolinate synthase family protein [Gammaproteobacteria bacterium]|nr:dihydrodipicolinate synthase family protein [Gammaproteobacteria bacterium]